MYTQQHRIKCLPFKRTGQTKDERFQTFKSYHIRIYIKSHGHLQLSTVLFYVQRCCKMITFWCNVLTTGECI